MKALWRSSVAAACYWIGTTLLWGGGSGLNVVVVVNQNSTNSVQLGNYYCERRQVPPQNLLRINWTGGNTYWSNSDFTAVLLNPLLDMVASRQLTNQIDYVVLSMDIPYRVIQGGDTNTAGANSTTAVLYYGFKADGAAMPGVPASCNLPDASSNSYAGSESVFRLSPPATAPTNAFLAMMITSSNLSQAEAIVDRGVSSDGTFPPQPVILGKSTDPFRNVRFLTFDNAIFNTRLVGNYTLFRTNSDSPYGYANLLGYQDGLYQFSVSPGTFVPGAIADSLTSYAGLLYEPDDQTILLVFLNGGATGSYGTIVEPCNYLEKFPTPETYFFQSRGFSLAECYYQGLTNPFQGILVGEPLAAPFARAGTGGWLGLPPNSMLAGTTNLSVQFTASDAQHPLEQVDLFLDGRWLQTLTNAGPTAGNLLEVNLRGRTMDYVVPGGATIASVVNGLTATLNNSANTNVTKALAFAHGDRIELQSIDRSTPGELISVSVSNSMGTGSGLTSYISAALPELLDTIASGLGTFTVLGNPTNDTILTTNSFLECVVTELNLTRTTLGVTNTSGALSLTQMGEQLFAMVNSNAAFQGPGGLSAQDFLTNTTPPPEAFQFNLVPNTPGWNSSQIRVSLAGSPELTIQPSLTGRLDDNVSDLRPRNHLYVTAGATNLWVTFPLDTTTLADGFHELTAVASEGSHVRTQTQVSEVVQVRNSALTATFSTLFGGTNADLNAVLQFSVAANGSNIDVVQLFSTGGAVGSVSNQASAVFSVPASSLGIGLHPFYAVVTDNTGAQYRTETRWVRILGDEPQFSLSITLQPTTLSWPATVGRTYEVLTTTNLGSPFLVTATLTPSNSPAQWTETNPAASQRFYRVQSSN